MELLLSLPKFLIKFALCLLTRKVNDRTRKRLAGLLCHVSDCVSAINDNIQNGAHPAEQCAELDTYVANLHSLVAKETDEAAAIKLTFWLKHVEAVPDYAEMDFGSMIEAETKTNWSKSKRLKQSQEVKEIAGIIRGIGNFVHV